MILTGSPNIRIEAGAVDESIAEEIYRNLLVLYGSRAGEQALDRDFGIDANINDYPQESAQALLAAEYVRKTQRYEPRATVLRVEWVSGGEPMGVMTPKVVVSFG